MSEFSYKKRGLQITQFSDTHVAAAMHTNNRGGEVEVVASHHPQTAEGAENPCEEFTTVEFTHRQETRKESGDFSLTGRTSDGFTFYGTLDDVEALHFALGELLEQSRGLQRGAASVRVIGKPQATVEEA